MEMLQLRYFYESAMWESFSKTARKYMVPVSSVSASVKRLEQELGVELFTRTRNRILLTEKGRQFLAVVEESLDRLDMGVDRLLSDPAQKGTLTVLVRCARESVTRQIIRFHQIYPSVSFKMVFVDSPEHYDRYDLIISDPAEMLSEYVSFPWRNFILHVVAAETDPLCRGSVTLSQLRDRMFAVTNSQKGGFKIFTQACKQQGFVPKILLECDDYACRTKALLWGDCLGLNVGNEENSQLPGLQYLSVTDFYEPFFVNVYYKMEKYVGNVKLFVDFLEGTAWK